VKSIGKVSYAVKKRYQDKTYKRIVAVVRKEKAAVFESKLKKQGNTQSGWINQKIDEYIEEDEK
jgi:hypothetical protein